MVSQELIKELGIFIAPLNNGDWMVGKASYIYTLSVEQNHYKDSNVCIGKSIDEAVHKWGTTKREKCKGCGQIVDLGILTYGLCEGCLNCDDGPNDKIL